MIKLEKVNKYFNKGKANQIHVIDNTSMVLPDRGIVCLLGPVKTHHFIYRFLRNSIRSSFSFQSLNCWSGVMSLHASSIAFLFISVSIRAYISVVE